MGYAVNLIEIYGHGGSSKKYYRFKDSNEAILVMDTPKFSLTRFLYFHTFYVDAGIRVPEIYTYDTKRRFCLIEDFGDNSYFDILRKTPEREFELVCDALKTLVKIHAIKPVGIKLPYLSKKINRYIYDFPRLYAKKFKCRSLNNSEHLDYSRISTVLMDTFHNQTKVVSHLDYHIKNLFETTTCTGIIDFCHTKIAPTSYDIVELLYELINDKNKQVEIEYVNKYWEYSKNTLSPIFDFSTYYRLYEYTAIIYGIVYLTKISRGSKVDIADVFQVEKRILRYAVRYRELHSLARIIEIRSA